jgi:tetratricopeptide (TPR) repeat protein
LGVPALAWTGPLLPPPPLRAARLDGNDDGDDDDSDDGDDDDASPSDLPGAVFSGAVLSGGAALSLPTVASLANRACCLSLATSTGGVLFPRSPYSLLQAQVAVERGHCFEAVGSWADAIRQYEHCLQLSSGGAGCAEHGQSPQVLQQLGWLLFSKRGDLSGAVAMLERATGYPAGTQDWRGWHLLGRLYMAQAAAATNASAVASAAATAASLCASATTPAAAPAAAATAAAAVAAAATTRALWSSAYRALECAVQLEPSSAAAWASVGVLMAHLQQHHDALDAFSRALKAAPRDAQLWCSVGLLYEAKQQPRDAREAYDQAAAVAKQAGTAPPKLATERLAAIALYCHVPL